MKTKRVAAAVTVLAVLGACARHHVRPVVSAPAAAPLPPTGTAPGLDVPQPDAPTINSAIGTQEAIWHVRAALNVGALSCGRRDPALVQRYNALLSRDKAVFSGAYAAETREHPGSTALDQHMTRLYNFFAQPPAQDGFCLAVSKVSAQVTALPPSEFAGFAPGALDRLEAPIRAYYRTYAHYREDLMAWQAHSRIAVQPEAAASRQPMPQTMPPIRREQGVSGDWRIQLGAFTGKVAAEAAWRAARTKVPSLATYEPHYQNVPHSPLVRLQLGSETDRGGALKLCATAAAGGFDCMAVSTIH